MDVHCFKFYKLLGMFFVKDFHASTVERVAAYCPLVCTRVRAALVAQAQPTLKHLQEILDILPKC
jgi:hypothetical protein